jgi:hypothetical protein
MTKRVVMFSGGIGSWAAAKRVANQYGTDDLFLVFSDVKGNNPSPHVGEDEDTYRFVKEAAANVGGTYIYLNEGKDIWEVFKEKKYLGNSRLAHCSHILKQKPARKWLDDNCNPEDTVVYVGIDWSEIHRMPAIVRNYLPFRAEAPLTQPPYADKNMYIAAARAEGLRTPRLYDLGFAHNNCGGGCVRAGQAQFKKLLEVMPDRFAVWETKEAEMQNYLGKDVSILTEIVKGEKRSLPLSELRKRAEDSPQLIDIMDFGGCGCFVEYEEEIDKEKI